jgi:hypothetical protein
MVIEAIPDNPAQESEFGEPITLRGETPFLSLFCPTARSSTRTETEYSRNRSSIYAVGYREAIQFHTNNGGQWVWRRIVFSMKGPQIHQNFPQNTLFSFRGAGQGESGYSRPFWNLLGAGPDTNVPREPTEDLLFSGESGKDWYSRLTAKVDSTRVTVHMDRIRNIRGGNAEARRHTYKDWVPIRKNILYDEEESGDVKTFADFSVNSKIGFGDLYVYDYIECNTPDDSYAMDLDCQACFYWHER